jgi:hypothetical protein
MGLLLFFYGTFFSQISSVRNLRDGKHYPFWFSSWYLCCYLYWFLRRQWGIQALPQRFHPMNCLKTGLTIMQLFLAEDCVAVGTSSSDEIVTMSCSGCEDGEGVVRGIGGVPVR